MQKQDELALAESLIPKVKWTVNKNIQEAHANTGFVDQDDFMHVVPEYKYDN